MPLEIERKFLVRGGEWRGAWPTRSVRQGYFTSADDVSVRVRVADRRGFITIKADIEEATRSEFEYEIPVEDAEAMVMLCQPWVVEKVRHEVLIDDRLWQVDEFEGSNAGLVLSEIELVEPNQAPLPPWIGSEVTQDVRYRNSYLARRPFTTWSRDAPQGCERRHSADC